MNKSINSKAVLILTSILFFFMLSCDDNPATTEGCPACVENASCNESTNKCECDEGFVLDGESCLAVEDKCKDVSCDSWKACDAEDGMCKLKDGFCEGDSCEGDKICNTEHKCEDAPLTCDGVLCSNHGNCVMHNNAPRCICDTDYKVKGTLECIHKRACGDSICSENATCVDNKCECNDGFIYNVITKKCVDDAKCENITCDAGQYCFDGDCFLENECSVDNLDGVCPTIGEVQFTCTDGLCISPNDGTKDRGEECSPALSECKSGLVCVDYFEDGRYQCRDFCDLTTSNSCPDNGLCIPHFDSFARNTGTCANNECVVGGDDCPTDFECEVFIDVNICVHVGSGEYGDNCDNDVETSDLDFCKSGLFCIGDEDEVKTCQEVCDPNASEDSCVNGRCISVQAIDGNLQNGDLGVCIDVPYFCDMYNGVTSNPDCSEDAVCFPLGEDVDACIENECELNSSTCEEEGEGCSRSFTSKNSCLKVGTLEFGDKDCINPDSSDLENIPEDKLCKAGLTCIDDRENGNGTYCSEMCDPTAENPCTSGENLQCSDFHNFIEEYPAGINGLCNDGPKICQQDEGISENPACGVDELCIPINSEGLGFCDGDTCEEDGAACENDEVCTRTITSKLHCVPIGTLNYNESGCSNPRFSTEDIPVDNLCSAGLTCVESEQGNVCREMCDPLDSTDVCENGTLHNCVDFNTIKNDFPAGINGVCM